MNIRNELGKLRNEVWHILQMDYSKRADFIPSILGRIDGILEAPKRNCEIGTAEEQVKRWQKFCETQACCEKCSCYKGGDISAKCFARWAQMPYKSEVKE